MPDAEEAGGACASSNFVLLAKAMSGTQDTPPQEHREVARLCSHNREQMTAQGYFICFNLWYANSDAAADVL